MFTEVDSWYSELFILLPMFVMEDGWSSEMHLIVSLGHMVVLSVLGVLHVKRVPQDNLDIGSRIATMGYLHTLLGITSALIVVGQLNMNTESATMMDEIRKMLMPIGSALTTSIIGWAIGKELQRDNWGDDKTDLDMSELDIALKDLVRYLQAWSLNIDEASDRTKVSIDAFCMNLENSSKKLSEVELKSSDALGRLNGLLSGMDGKEGVDSTVRHFVSDMKKSIEESSKLPDNLGDVNTKMGELLMVMKSMDALIARMEGAK
jgi:hypothetical protein